MKGRFGFSILELMIAVGISGMAAVGVMQMTDDQVKVQKRVQVEFDLETLVGTAQRLLNNRNACSATFNGMNLGLAATPIGAPPISLGDIVGPGGGNLISEGTDYGNLTINEINFIHKGEIGDVKGASGANMKMIIGDIEIVAERRAQILISNAREFTKRLPFPVKIVVDAGGTVTGADSGCVPAAENIDERVVREFCLMITNNNVPGAAATLPLTLPYDCDTTLTAGENSGSLPDGGANTDQRALSVGSLINQIDLYDDLGGPTTNATLFKSNPETLAKFIPLTGGTAGDLTFSGGLTINSNLNSAPGNAVVTLEYLRQKNRFDQATACPTGQLGIAGGSGRICSSACGNNQYSGGFNLTGADCKNLINARPHCPEGQGQLVILSTGAIEFQC